MAVAVLFVMAVTYTIAAEVTDKTWIFTVSANRRPYNYIDDEGKLVGFDLELVKKVCDIAGKKCTLTVQPFTECVQTVKGRFFPGRGIMAGWFDACMGYVITQDRINALQFTIPYLETDAKLAVKPGNPKSVSLKNLASHTITHLNGAYTNKQCLTRLKLNVSGVVVAADLPEAKALVLNGTVDAAFSPRTRIPDLQTLDVSLHCDLGGVGVMVTKDSTLPVWWNPAFRQFVKSGEYNKTCDNWMKKTNSRIKCVDLSSGGQQHSGGETVVTDVLCITTLAALFIIIY